MSNLLVAASLMLGLCDLSLLVGGLPLFHPNLHWLSTTWDRPLPAGEGRSPVS